MSNIANHDPCGKRATRKRIPKVGIIIGCHRIRGTVDDLIAIVCNGLGAVRTGRDYRIIASEAFETWRLQ
jgi:hypothetical protein